MNQPVLTSQTVLQFGENEVSQRRLELLRAIHICGSISGAAKVVGMTYKAAWDAVDAINNLAGRPLVSVQHGGKGGGGAELTEDGRRILLNVERMEMLRKAFFSAIGSNDLKITEDIIRRFSMKTSARNTLTGTVSEIIKGAVNSEVKLKLPGGDVISALITNESVKDLCLSEGSEAYAIIKATWVLLAEPDAARKTSARNVLCGKVSRIQVGPVNAEVTVSLSGQNTITAMITKESLQEMDIKEGKSICALVKASHVVIGVN